MFYAEQNPKTTLSCALIYVATFRAAIEVCGDRGLRPALESLRHVRLEGRSVSTELCVPRALFLFGTGIVQNAQRTQPLAVSCHYVDDNIPETPSPRKRQ